MVSPRFGLRVSMACLGSCKTHTTPRCSGKAFWRAWGTVQKWALTGRGSLRQGAGRRESNRGPWHPGKRSRPEYRAGCGPPRPIGDILARGSSTGGSCEARRPRSKVGRREPPSREISILREGGSLRPTFEPDRPASHDPCMPAPGPRLSPMTVWGPHVAPYSGPLPFPGGQGPRFDARRREPPSRESREGGSLRPTISCFFPDSHPGPFTIGGCLLRGHPSTSTTG